MNKDWNIVNGKKVTIEDIEKWQADPVTILFKRFIKDEHISSGLVRDAADTPNDKVNFYRGKCVGLSTQLNVEVACIKQLQQDYERESKGGTQ